MPMLDNPRHEIFCQARADGLSREEAYEAAGYAPGNNHAYRLMARQDVRTRIEELRSRGPDLSGATTAQVIATLLAVADKLTRGPTVTPQAAKEARETLIQANQLREHLLRQRHDERLEEASEIGDETFLEEFPEAGPILAAERQKERETRIRQFTPWRSESGAPALGHFTPASRPALPYAT